jgi:hypothetical protein
LGEWPLRDGLPRIAEGCDIGSRLRQVSPTPKQLAGKQNRTIKLCKALLVRLDDPRNYNSIDPNTRWPHFPFLARPVARARADLSALVGALECCRDELMGIDSRGKHFQSMHIQFWKEATHVWCDNVKAKWRGKHLERFLISCSKPFFPEATTGGAISAFIERGTISSK